jgi:hypothetical protein
MTRELTPFQQGLRSDLLSGGVHRWEVSSPRDELEKFRFFARQMETLIDQAEQSEIVSLKGSIVGLSQEGQDEFWLWNYPVHWDEIFRATIQNSMVVSLATFLETFLDRLCSHVSLITRSELNVRDLRGSILEASRKYLTAIGKFKAPNPAAWTEIGLFFKIRHVIVHVGGFTLGTNHQKAIEQFCKSRSDIRLEHGSIEIEPAFVEFLINQLQEFIQQLESDFKALCEDTRQVES